MGSNKKLWRVVAGHRGREAFNSFGDLAHKIKSSIDYGHLEGRSAELVGIILVLALKGEPGMNVQNYGSLGPESVRAFAKKCKWPSAAEIIAAAKRERVTMNAEEAWLYLEVAKMLMETSAEAKIELDFFWDEV